MKHMLIDARNAVYRAVYASISDIEFTKAGKDPSLIFFRFLHSYYQRYRPESIHFFWDAPKQSVWRKKLFPGYKEGRERSEQVDALVERCSRIIRAIAPHIACRNYGFDKQEADDLIFAFCRLFCRQRNLIVSSDGDFRQIVFLYPNVTLWNPLGKTQYEPDEFDPVTLKCLEGEKGDNIKGYDKIGPVRAKEIAADPIKRDKFFEERGEDPYILNRALIDLTVCPYLLQNMLYVDEVSRKPVEFEMKKAMEIILEMKARGLSGEIKKNVAPFRKLK